MVVCPAGLVLAAGVLAGVRLLFGLLLVVDGGQLFGALDLVLKGVALGGHVPGDGLRAADLPSLVGRESL